MAGTLKAVFTPKARFGSAVTIGLPERVVTYSYKLLTNNYMTKGFFQIQLVTKSQH